MNLERFKRSTRVFQMESRFFIVAKHQTHIQNTACDVPSLFIDYFLHGMYIHQCVI